MIQIIQCDQGSEEWIAARLGIPTASCFATVMAKGKDGGPSLTRAKYMRQLVGEILTGQPMETYSNAHMDRGKDQEADARNLYAFMHDCKPQLVGFVRNGPKGCSPDSLVDANGGLEIKSCLPDIQVERLLANKLPSEHRAQVQGSLWIAEREWWDFTSYCPKLPLFVTRIYRDEEYISTLSSAVDRFNDDLAEMVENVRRLSGEGQSLRDNLNASLEAA